MQTFGATTTKKLVGQVLVLTKNVWLIEPTHEKGYKAQFFVGKRDPFECGGLATTWWHTKASFSAVEKTAFILMSSLNEFRDCDLETVTKIIKETLTEICVDKRLFNPDQVCFGGRPTLFECRHHPSVEEFGKLIVDEVISNLRNQLSLWCTVYTAPRIAGESFFVPEERLHAIKRDDVAKWDELIANRFSTDSWSPVTGFFRERDPTIFSSLKYAYVFICESDGSQKGSRFSSELKLRKLFSVLFSLLSEKSTHCLGKSGGQPHTACLQFPSKTRRGLGITMSTIGELVPYYISDYVLNGDDIASVKAWFRSVAAMERESANRIEKCAHFINRAMNSNDIESYVSYFVALDALFGSRGSVEKSIAKGIESLNGEGDWSNKIRRLFDLRNELVHGGSRYAEEWAGYYDYYRHFGTRPERDIEKIAFAALYRAPTALS